MYLFDTDIICNILKKRPSSRLLEKLAGIPRQDQYISTITIAEIVYGAMKSNRSAFHLKNLETILLPAVNIRRFDLKAAYVCGRLRAELERRGIPLPLADLEIASIAMANGDILITGNCRHFQRIEGLLVDNWI